MTIVDNSELNIPGIWDRACRLQKLSCGDVFAAGPDIFLYVKKLDSIHILAYNLKTKGEMVFWDLATVLLLDAKIIIQNKE